MRYNKGFWSIRHPKWGIKWYGRFRINPKDTGLLKKVINEIAQKLHFEFIETRFVGNGAEWFLIYNFVTNEKEEVKKVLAEINGYLNYCVGCKKKNTKPKPYSRWAIKK